MNELSMRLYGKNNKTNRHLSPSKERTNQSSVRPLAMMLFNKTDKTNRND